nr:immunoglobulin light chain junction region [Macaca mulatta]MOW04804.1 immunoglobulin light chain junction region [Macaca mulatta]MOW04960.1 immunoglobulin light chain junction region [Macaca mulatta]MOW06062.1 immunoglobulin light chain junction region [Macaca mulatta]MOW06776.1 immunoglobulin light chain junction region [Macaca mulatta]
DYYCGSRDNSGNHNFIF